MATATVRLIVSPDPTLTMRETDRIIQEARAAGDVEIQTFNGNEFFGDNTPDLYSTSLFSVPKLILIRNVDGLNAANRDQLVEIVKQGNLETSLVLTSEKLKPIMKLSNLLKKQDPSSITTLALPSDYDERGWKTLVKDEFARQHLQVTNDGINALFDTCGNNYAKMVQNVALIASSTAKNNAKITEKEVHEIVTSRGSRGAFAIADAMMERDTTRALVLLEGALEGGDNALAILGALTHSFKQLIATTTTRPASETGVSVAPFAVKKFKGNLRNFGPGEVTVALNHLIQADFAAKSGGMDPALALERCIIGITTPHMPAPTPDSLYM